MAESTTLITDAEFLNMALASNTINGVTVAVRDQARSDASDKALSYVKKRHALPLTSWGNDLKRATADIAAWYVLSFRGFNPANATDIEIRERHMTALSWLRDVAKGNAELVDVIDSSTDTEEAAPLVASEDTKWKTWRT